MGKKKDKKKLRSKESTVAKGVRRELREFPKTPKLTLENSVSETLSSPKRPEVRSMAKIASFVQPTKKSENEQKDAAVSPIFRELAEPKLPRLPKENRARLQMQSPTRIYFYWSIRNNPFKTLDRALGKSGNYTLIAKLINKTLNTEELFPVETEGNWWFEAAADSSYQAEIGFYSPNRPFVRIMFSNSIQTPRKSPSKRKDLVPHFDVSATQFAEVLDASGYQRDAFEVAFAGDDHISAETATQETYFELVGKETKQFSLGKGDELRFALLALASGYSLDDVGREISKGLFDELKAERQNLRAEKVFEALESNFDVSPEELFEEQEIGSAVFGTSLVHFPRQFAKRKIVNSLVPKLSSLSKTDSSSS